jgi:hypothetical protein
VKNLLKNLAGVLVGLLFGIASAYAIKGGPQFPSQTNVVGTYGGVLTPTGSPCPSITPAPACSPSISPCAANSIGVFSVGAPQSGLATGTFVMFAQGRVFTGTIRGVADPHKATLNGVLSARYDFTVTRAPTPCPCDFGGFASPCAIVTPTPACTPSSFSQNITALANGSLKTRITTSSNGFTGTGATRLRGSATLDISNGTVSSTTFEQNVDCEIFLKVSGFKQSNIATSTTGANPTGTP